MYQKIFHIDHFHFKIFYSKDSLLRLKFSHQKKDLISPQISLKINQGKNLKFAKHVQEQLDAYFQRKLKKFDIPCTLKGSDFSKKVLARIEKIPYGKTKSYKEIANLVKRPSAWRAVGRASGSNPIPIVIPCHRVIKSSGDLGGYSGSGGILFKSYLQLLEKK